LSYLPWFYIGKIILLDLFPILEVQRAFFFPFFISDNNRCGNNWARHRADVHNGRLARCRCQGLSLCLCNSVSNTSPHTRVCEIYRGVLQRTNARITFKIVTRKESRVRRVATGSRWRTTANYSPQQLSLRNDRPCFSFTQKTRHFSRMVTHIYLSTEGIVIDINPDTQEKINVSEGRRGRATIVTFVCLTAYLHLCQTLKT